MKNLINLIIIFIILYIIYDCLFNNIEGFSNDAFQYLEQIHKNITKNNFDNLNVSNDLSVSNNSNFIKGIDGNIIIDNNLLVDGNITGKNGYVKNIIINKKWPIYTKKNALAIGRLNGSNSIIPALYMNPGSEENLWVFEHIDNDKFWFYAWDNKGPNLGFHDSNDFNMNDILINNNKSTFIPFDKLN